MQQKALKPAGSDSSRKVAVCDALPDRAGLVSDVIRQCSAEPYNISISSGTAQPFCSVVLVALSNSTFGPSNQLLQLLTARGIKVLCYGDGVRQWSLATRCRILLTGVERLLDSEYSDFSAELFLELDRLLEATDFSPREETKLLMRRLGVVGESPAIVSAFQMVVRVSAVSDPSVLLLGETGTGKELFARAIHHLDPKRSNKPFIAVDCAALHPNLVESELFGFRRGAFTGADRNREGLICSASSGVLFLDEVGELTPLLQTKLLRVLQERRVLKLGEDTDSPVDLRVIAATNREIDTMVKDGLFREDLFHRLNTLRIRIPPLRERSEDIRPLIKHFLEKHRSLSIFFPESIDPDCIEALCSATLPGNARQLENLICRALVGRQRRGPLSLMDLGPEIWLDLCRDRIVDPLSGEAPSDSPGGERLSNLDAQLDGLLTANQWNLSRSMRHVERLLVSAALRRTRGNQSAAARLLGITARSVYSKLHRAS